MTDSKTLIVEYSKKLYDLGLVPGKSGNVSIKFKSDDGSDLVAITPTLVSLGDLTEDKIVVIDLDGNILSDGKPSSEYVMHCSIYKNREDVSSIVHTHSPFATGYAHSNKKIKRYEGFGPIKAPTNPEIKYYKPGTLELAENVGKAFKENQDNISDVLILKNHGIITVGSDIEEASNLAEFIELTAKTQYISQTLNSL
ncbi:class II aldolase/adducin family protein [Methanobrevibacter sp. AbM4]|uniref:class II aldolase/adducin family protein n=1 Tax=Methanobrevibacter sp. AbM4 TaxID=224719 RepID=UPI0003348F53|nr:class II aldolase/adducin family protein [Methanobrevibacter sp. AbM4]AGN17591.1 class II aldolase/adducin family protein [Methanobrevibacter sp. AbM4]